MRNMLINPFKTIIFTVSAVFVLISFSYGSADEIKKPTVIDWDDSIPKMPRLNNPLDSLTNEQLADFDFLMSTRNMRQQNFISNVDEAFKEGDQVRHKLERQGLDIDALISSYERLELEVKRRNQMTNTTLENKIVRIPGYALPLEHKNIGVKELLLVPYVGACIHVPPPPANQTIYVRLEEAHIIEGIYEPIWITGRLSAKATNKTLSLVDGSASVSTGYTLDGFKIEPHKAN